jgi:hypothetical protein
MKKASIRRAAAIVVCAIGVASIVAPAAAAGRQQDRPMKGSCLASFVFVGENTLAMNGTCQLTHLGLTTWTAVQTLSIGPGGVQQIVNDTTYRAANGDLLYGHFSGTGTQVDPVRLTFTGTETYTGGTGHFAGVSGHATVTGGATFTGFVPVPSGTGFWTTSGTIDY